MKGMRHSVALAIVFALTSLGMTVEAQQRPYRLSDQQVKDLVSRIEQDTDTFRPNLDRALARSRIDVNRKEENINQFVRDFEQATDRLRDRVNDRRSGTADVEDVLRRASFIDSFLLRNQLNTRAEPAWQNLRRDLDDLARAYGVASNWTGSQNISSRVTDKQVEELLKRIEKDADQFPRSLKQALDRSRIDGSRTEDNINQFVTEFEEATDHLRDHVNRRQVVTFDIEELLRRGVSIDNFMQRYQLTARAENDWLKLRRDLDDLARAYNVAWNWSNPRYTALEPSTGGLYYRLTGTYQLERNRGDDPRQVAEQAAGALPSNQRQRVYQNLMNRLEAPDVLAINRNANRVTIASSRGQQVTFEADGRVRTEQMATGQASSTRATLYGDQLVVATTDTNGNDFTVTFEPVDAGRNLRVTHRIYHDDLRQPVTAQSFYRQSSDEAQWDIYSSTSGAPFNTRTASGDFGVPNGTRLVATLDHALSTDSTREGDRFTTTTRSPSEYEGAVMDGFVSNVNASGRISGRADMSLNFQSIRLRNGRTYEFAGFIENLRTPNGETLRVDNEGKVEDKDSQTSRTIQRGAIGAGVGALIGAIAGGGKGAAIGAAAGAGAGAGTVIIQGRDHLDLPSGTELTITSTGAPSFGILIPPSNLIRQMQMDLEAASSRGILSNIDSSKFDDYPRFQDMIERLARENILRVYFRQVSNSIQVDREQTILDAEMEMTRKDSDRAPQRRRQQLALDFERTSQGWKIINITPREFFRPL